MVAMTRLLPETWTNDMWARATTRTLPEVRVIDGRRMVSDATRHRAFSVGDGLWAVDWLPGRQFTAAAAHDAMLIALAPDWPEVERWARELGLTANEARGLVGVA